MAATRLTTVGRHWGWTLAYGIVTLAAGIAALAWPAVTLLAIAVVFGVQLIVGGIFRFVALFTSLSHRELPNREWAAFTGALSLIAGIILLIYPAISVAALAIVVGLWLLVFGFMEISLALRMRSLLHPARA